MGDVPLFLVSEGKAYYSALAAYQKFFAEDFEVTVLHKKDLPRQRNLDRAIVWQMMGYYPVRPSARLVIHDYRSASIGRFGALKDMMKRFYNVKPDARIFLNNEVHDRFSFADGVPEFFIDVGVPSGVFDTRLAAIESVYDFCYVGVINRERQIDRMINLFDKTYGNSKSLLLVGQMDREISKIVEGKPSIHCTGRVSQAEVFSFVRSSKYAISWIPDHAPYHYQTPTKLLEYAALGMPVIVNASRSNLMALEKFSISAEIAKNNFPTLQSLEKIKLNDPSSFYIYEWRNLIENSGINYFLRQRLLD